MRLRPDRRRSLAFAILALAVLAHTPLRAEERWLLEGLADLEAWSTDGSSDLLARNEDRAASYVPSAAEDVGLDGLLLVADGLGGERAGERASQLTADRLGELRASGA